MSSKKSACVVHEWGSILVLHRRDPKKWEFAVSEEGTEEGAVKASKDLMNVELAIRKKLLEADIQKDGKPSHLVLYLCEVKEGIPKTVDDKAYDRVRYIEIPILWKKPDELSPEVRALLDALKQKKIILQ